jgi:AcrR family transcriptional regulator
MGTAERKEREKHEMVKLILEAARKLFVEQGYDNVTIRNIAQEIEYSPATIYLYFKDKDEIFFTLQSRAFEEFHKIQKSVQSIEDPLERLMAHGKAYVKFAFENPEYYDLMFIMKEPVKAITSLEEWKGGASSYDLLRQNVRECIERGLLNTKDVETASFALWSFVHGISSLKIRRGMMIPEQYLQYLVDGAFKFLMSNLKK